VSIRLCGIDPDAELLNRLQGGEAAALVELSERHGPRIRAQAQRYLDNREDAEEVLQDVLVKVWRHLHRFRADAALTSWIHRITFNTAMSHLRRRNRAGRLARVVVTVTLPRSTRRLEPGDWSGSAEEATLRRQFMERLTEAFAEMPDIYRAPVILRDVEGLSIEDASAVLRLNKQTLKSRVHRGRRFLQRQLADFRGGLAMHPRVVPS
jgi:RNA polymerase sigma-70 factor (ECF subfamily)